MISGVTGNIEFDQNGNRKNFLLQLLDVGFMEVHSRIGNWSEATGKLDLESEYKTDSGAFSVLRDSDELVDITKRPMRITAVLVRPQTH